MGALRKTMFFIYRQYKNFNELCFLAKRSHHYYPFWTAKFYPFFFYSLKLYISGKFIPDEIIQFGFYSKKFTNREISRFISRRKLFDVQSAINPVTWTQVTEDKGVFYRYCDSLGIPTPQLYAIFFRSSPGWSYKNEILTSKKEWISFFGAELPETFVIKACNGVYGRGLYVLKKGNGHFLDATGNTYTPSELYVLLISHPDYKNFVIQERLINHPDIATFSGSEHLQTVRIITSISKEKGCQQIVQFLKIIQGDNYIDNFDSGKTGNLIARIDTSDGALRPAVTFQKESAESKVVKEYMDNGTPINGFKLPFWEESCQLAKEAALKFLPIQTVGWDIAITPNGPYIIEGNFWWDFPPIDENESIEDIMSHLF